MNLKFANLMKKINLPKRYFDNSFVISEKFKEEMDTFLALVKEYKGESEGLKKEQPSQIIKAMDEVIKKAEKASNTILKIFEYHEQSNLAQTQQLMDDLIELLEEDIFVGSIDDYIQFKYKDKTSFIPGLRITHGSRFFRIRAVDDKTSDIQENADELFHIPLSKRAYTSNERFSLVGFPSLYLSTMLPLAWQESGSPKKYYYSEYQYYCTDLTVSEKLSDKELKFLLLYSPKEIADWGIALKYNKFELWLEIVTRYLKTYPLVLACSFVNHSGKVTYKQEYIIPQMLMQWVQRNNKKIQGISYFTCIDNIMNSTDWCAYNIAIPAMPPYDEKKYSKPLKEKFNWTIPKFYSIPLFNKKENEKDREFIYNLIIEAEEVMHNSLLPAKHREVLFNAIQICRNLMCIMGNHNSIDMQLVLYNLNLLSENIRNIEKMKLHYCIETDIKKGKKLGSFSQPDLDYVIKDFKNVYCKLVDDKFGSKSISQIIKKYNDLCWNDLHPHSEIWVVPFSILDVDKSIKWLKQNHILYKVKKAPSDVDLITFLKSIALNANVSIDVFWDCLVENDDWIKDNIDKIKTPLFFRTNDVSIYSTPDTNHFEFINAGYDEKILSDKLREK